MQFNEWPKIARLSRDCVITEKLDGTNASVFIPETPQEQEEIGGLPFLVGSRTRWITPENDNYGFARWAYDHSEELLKLGPGHHFGEWWGQGIQRKYGLTEKRFSLFNVGRWNKDNVPSCVGVVPILYEGLFTTSAVEAALYSLVKLGSAAAPGFMKPEGVVVFHKAAGVLFKKTLEKDEQPKGKA